MQRSLQNGMDCNASPDLLVDGTNRRRDPTRSCMPAAHCYCSSAALMHARSAPHRLCGPAPRASHRSAAPLWISVPAQPLGALTRPSV
ncbi:hypothetical protein ACFPM0_21675 [Pseudonocardia sulfidoxydans]|uniref:hypothetical protein n=1 Tax=Pseudonocardia sulfidoxydans TaxID=54011 RepID=UPI00360EEF8A